MFRYVPFRSVTFYFSMDNSPTSANNSKNCSSGSSVETTTSSTDLKICDTTSEASSPDIVMKRKVGEDEQPGSGDEEVEEEEEEVVEDEGEIEDENEDGEDEEEIEDEDEEYIPDLGMEGKSGDEEEEMDQTESDELEQKHGKSQKNEDNENGDANKNIPKAEVRDWLDQHLLIHGPPPKDGRNFRSSVYKNGGIRFLFWAHDSSEFENWFGCESCDWVGFAVPRKGTSLLSKHARSHLKKNHSKLKKVRWLN